MSKCLTSPCKDCPWSRSVRPGALGGSPAETFLGQVVGPFILPCHHDCDFSDPEGKLKVAKVTPCAGAAIFRANLHVSSSLPAVLQRLPPDTSLVFADGAEFLAHHKNISLKAARLQLSKVGLAELGQQQLQRSTNVTHTVQKVVR